MANVGTPVDVGPQNISKKVESKESSSQKTFTPFSAEMLGHARETVTKHILKEAAQLLLQNLKQINIKNHQ